MRDNITYLPVPAPLRVVTDLIELFGIAVDVPLLESAAREPQAGIPGFVNRPLELREVNAAERLLELADADGTVLSARHKMSGRTHRLHSGNVSALAGAIGAAFIARPGKTLLSVSPRQSALRVATALSGDDRMRQALITDDVFKDLLFDIPSEIGASRNEVKYAVFHALNGSPPSNMSGELFRDEESVQRYEQVRDVLRQILPALHAYIDETQKLAGGTAHLLRADADAANLMFMEAWSKVNDLDVAPVLVHNGDTLVLEIAVEHLNVARVSLIDMKVPAAMGATVPVDVSYGPRLG
jgi:hypothetical protein